MLPALQVIRVLFRAVQGGAHHTFVCRGSDDKALRSLEIVFNNEHHKKCEYTEAAATKSADCRFENFYVGADMNGKTVPMACQAQDWAGRAGTHSISVKIGATDTRAPYVQFQRPASGATIQPGYNDFTCYASDDKSLQSIEILFNNEHRYQCNYGPVTSGTCTFASFYVGADMNGRTVPMRCTARDLAGNQSQHDISVRVQSQPTSLTPERGRLAQATSPPAAWGKADETQTPDEVRVVRTARSRGSS